ncbi:hypothetical protein [Stutzerimonas kunmingensis]|uniref:hypothetical protein n=1 Tax=Stutzerimonas kunmingensis TaxID=1211807 RepID=UPI002FCB4FB4
MIRSADGFRIPLASSGGPLVLLLELTKFVMERIGLAEHYNETDHGENVFMLDSSAGFMAGCEPSGYWQSDSWRVAVISDGGSRNQAWRSRTTVHVVLAVPLFVGRGDGLNASATCGEYCDHSGPFRDPEGF